MTAEAFAALVDARRTGSGKWQARCPAHRDRSPSLSIRDGPDGRVLVHCFAGCTHTAILAALGLSRRDLFAGPPPSPEQAAALRLVREQREREARAERQGSREAWDRVRRWDAVVSALGARLARAPDSEGAELARLFQAACDRLHEAETQAERWNPAQSTIATP